MVVYFTVVYFMGVFYSGVSRILDKKELIFKSLNKIIIILALDVHTIS